MQLFSFLILEPVYLRCFKSFGLISFPNCKINLGLYITNKRSDGYHDLETIFYPLPYNDVLEIIQTDEDNHLPNQQQASPVYKIPGLAFSSSGLALPGQPEDNICFKAWQLIKNDYPDLPPIRMHLHKTIPAGAGLGGGSADGAFCLSLLNTKFQLGIAAGKLSQYALALGSDCPFFILNKPAIATSRGEVLEEIPLDLSACKLVLVNPGLHISTVEAFAGISPKKSNDDLKKIATTPVAAWKHNLHNQFEETVFAKYPLLATIKETLYRHGALYAAMSGTGATVYGIFHKDQKTEFDFPNNWMVKELACQF